MASICTKSFLNKALSRAEEWLSEGESELVRFGQQYALASPQALKQRYVEGPVIRHALQTIAKVAMNCPSMYNDAREEYAALRDRVRNFARKVDRTQGEERMRAGMFGDLGRPWSPRKKRGPSCRRVWVRGYTR